MLGRGAGVRGDSSAAHELRRAETLKWTSRDAFLTWKERIRHALPCYAMLCHAMLCYDAFLTWKEALRYRATVVMDGDTAAEHSIARPRPVCNLTRRYATCHRQHGGRPAALRAGVDDGRAQAGVASIASHRIASHRIA